MTSSKRGWWWRVTVMLVLLSLVLAACGSGGGTPAGSTAAGASTAASSGAASTGASAAPAESAAATSASGAAESAAGSAAAASGATQAAGEGFKLNPDVSGTIDFWHFWSSPLRRNAIRRVVQICQEKLPNIQVTETAKPFNDIWTANIAAVSAGSGMPDVIVEDRAQLPARAQQNIETSLQEFATRDGVDGSQFWDFAWNQTLYENQTYGLPFETDVRVLFWNKNAFKEAGLDPEKPPTTWAELEEYANKLDKKAADGTYERIGFYPLISMGPDIWGYTNDVQWVKDGKPAVNDPKVVETLEWIKKWTDRYGGWQAVQNFRAQFASPPNDPFMSGKVAMIADIAGYQRQLVFFAPQVKNAEGNNEALQWGVSDVPYNTDKGMWSGGFALSIPRGARNPEAAWEFIKCAAGPDGATSWSRDTYAIPAYKAAADDPQLTGDPAWQFFINAMDYTETPPFVAAYPNWGEQLKQREEKVWTGELTPQQAVEEAQQAIEQQMNSQ